MGKESHEISKVILLQRIFNNISHEFFKITKFCFENRPIGTSIESSEMVTLFFALNSTVIDLESNIIER